MNIVSTIPTLSLKLAKFVSQYRKQVKDQNRFKDFKDEIQIMTTYNKFQARIYRLISYEN
jgi:hypothetical protein